MLKKQIESLEHYSEMQREIIQKILKKIKKLSSEEGESWVKKFSKFFKNDAPKVIN